MYQKNTSKFVHERMDAFEGCFHCAVLSFTMQPLFREW